MLTKPVFFICALVTIVTCDEKITVENSVGFPEARLESLQSAWQRYPKIYYYNKNNWFCLGMISRKWLRI